MTDKLHNITHRMRALADQYATQVPVGVPTQIRNLADELDAIAVCPECGGRGEVLDAPSEVLSGLSYWTPCPVCGGKK